MRPNPDRISRRVALLSFFLAAGACHGPDHTNNPDATDAPGTGTDGGGACGLGLDGLDPRRSSIVSELQVLEPTRADGPFAFAHVMEALAASAGASAPSPQALFDQWLDTQNLKPGLGRGPHCDDESDATGPTFHGFPIECPRPEGALVGLSIGSPETFRPVGIIYRVDLAAADWSSCGEVRISYEHLETARENGVQIIFEAAIPNPQPERGAAGCRPLLEFWAHLATDALDASAVQARLKRLFFDGLATQPPIPPVVRWQHYAAGGGRINALLQLGNVAGAFKTFRTACEGPSCTLRIVPDGAIENPDPRLFQDADTSTRAVAFRAAFLTAVPQLAATNPNQIKLATPPEFDAPASVLTPREARVTRNDYLAQVDLAGPFAHAIAGAVPAGAGLTTTDVLNRATMASCAGCHDAQAPIGGGLEGFTTRPNKYLHIDGSITEPGAYGNAFALSVTLKQVILPYRVTRLKAALAAACP